MEAIWFGMKLAVGLLLGLVALYLLCCFIVLIGGGIALIGRAIIDSLGAPQSEQSDERKPIEWMIMNFEQALLAHENKVRRLGNDMIWPMAAIKQERTAFARCLGLLDDPSAYHSEPAYYRYRHKYRQNGDIWECRFVVEGAQYTLLVNEARQLESCPPPDAEDAYYIRCSLQDNHGDVVFSTKLNYSYTENNYWGGYNYAGGELEAFKPGMWVKCLLQKMLEFGG